jgi:uncharacterized protein DUF6683
MKANSYFKVFALTLAVLALCRTGAAQTDIYGMIRSTNQSLWSAQRDYQKVLDNTKALGSESEPPSSSTPQYPITATDFRSLPYRLLPDQLVNEMTGVTLQQRQATRALYYQFLADFENNTRKNNVATALAFALTLSLRAAQGRALSQAEVNQLAADLNDRLAIAPEFMAMTAKEKQTLYERLIITGGSIVALQTQGIQQNNVLMQLQAKQLAQSVLGQ